MSRSGGRQYGLTKGSNPYAAAYESGFGMRRLDRRRCAGGMLTSIKAREIQRRIAEVRLRQTQARIGGNLEGGWSIALQSAMRMTILPKCAPLCM